MEIGRRLRPTHININNNNKTQYLLLHRARGSRFNIAKLIAPPRDALLRAAMRNIYEYVHECIYVVKQTTMKDARAGNIYIYIVRNLFCAARDKVFGFVCECRRVWHCADKIRRSRARNVLIKPPALADSSLTICGLRYMPQRICRQCAQRCVRNVYIVASAYAKRGQPFIGDALAICI